MDAELIKAIFILTGIALSLPVSIGLYYRFQGMLALRRMRKEDEANEAQIHHYAHSAIDYELLTDKLAEKIVDELIRRGGLENVAWDR